MKDSFISLVTIFLLIVPGVVFGRKKYIDENQTKGMTKFLMNVVLPALIINSMQMEFDVKYLSIILKIILGTFAIFIIACLIGWLLCRLLKMEKHYFGLISFCLFFANTGSIGLPIINTLFGQQAVFYSAIVEIGVDVLIYTLGIVLIQLSAESEEKTLHIDPKKLLSPGLIGIIIGLVLFFCNIELPYIITNTFDKLGGASLLIAMFVIGFNLGSLKLRDLFSDIRIYIIVIVKMIVIPVLVFVLCRFVFGFDYEMSSVMTIMMAMPIGTAVVIFSEEYKANHIFASKCVILTTVSSIITIIPLTTILLANA